MRKHRNTRARRATREMLGLSKGEFAVLRRLDSPQKIHDFLFHLGQNFELDGKDTCHSVRTVLRLRRAHCIEGAMVAACAMWIHGEPPLLMDMQAVKDVDHVIALYRRGGLWGAYSKTNNFGLRGRDPIYRGLRELAVTYFHEYTNKRGVKTLRTYSRPFDLRRIDPKKWVTSEDGAWDLIDALEAARHYKLVTGRQARQVRRADRFETKLGNLLQYRRPRRR